ncbi:MAG: hypothetical protein WCF67_08335 [Chitinophagaceae bacterium]
MYKLFFALCLVSLSVGAQEKTIFDTSKIVAGVKLVGRYPQYDKQKTYKHLNFIIEDPAVIKHVITTLTLGEEGENIIEDTDFRISLIQDYQEKESFSVNPRLNSARYRGQT